MNETDEDWRCNYEKNKSWYRYRDLFNYVLAVRMLSV
jgi:hypothetical protein